MSPTINSATTRDRFVLRKWLIMGMLLLSLAGNVIQYGLRVKQEIHLVFALEQVEIIHLLYRRVHFKNDRMLQEMRDGIINYYPSGTKQVEGSKLDQIVEMVRTHAVEEIDWMLAGEPMPERLE